MVKIIIRLKNIEQDGSIKIKENNIIINKEIVKYDGRKVNEINKYPLKYYYNKTDNTGLYNNNVKDYINNNLVLFAYGQTGSGKTHTIFGDNSNPGLLLRICKDLFLKNKTYNISSYEIYRNEIYDLLNNKKKVRMFEHNLFIKKLSEVRVNSYEMILKIFNTVSNIRKVGGTVLNTQSSRSHCIFKIRTARHELVIIDLCGNEKIKYSLGNNYEDRRDTAFINKDLFTIKEVIRANAKSKICGYKHSKIASIVKNILDRTKNAIMICTINPNRKYLLETVDTLNYCSLVKGFKPKKILCKKSIRLNPIRLNPIKLNPIRLNPIRLNPIKLNPIRLKSIKHKNIKKQKSKQKLKPIILDKIIYLKYIKNTERIYLTEKNIYCNQFKNNQECYKNVLKHVNFHMDNMTTLIEHLNEYKFFTQKMNQNKYEVI